MQPREVIRRIKADGWYELPGKRTSHKQFKHPTKPGKATVAMYPGDISLPTLKEIEQQTGVRLT
ncbi:MAG: type II toxin-antitoxin system HicA family toxin [Desulfovibrio sp.]|jgi:predicted RNA binding protein YcfA (HicA-like mRNA interferase family)|nr:type II toxin-antitoxin system HicA family toxin [Desulfovibrio sp.]